MKPTYVTFEQAKLLREKGFNHETDSFWNSLEGKIWLNEYTSSAKNSNCVESCYSAPEHWQMVEWLRTNHGIWISVEPVDEFWKFIIFSKNATKAENLTRAFCNTPQEAYSAAFDYVLTNLI